MKEIGIRQSHVRTGLALATLLTFGVSCGGGIEAPDESSVGQLAQALTRGPWDFEGDPLDTYTQTDAVADFDSLYSWDTSNLIAVASTGGNEYLRVRLPSATEDQGAKFTPYLWPPGQYGEYSDSTVQWQIYLEPGWDFYNGDVKLGGIGGGRNYTGGNGDEAQNNCDGWSLRYILHGSPNNKVKAYYYGCDMTGTPSNGVLYGNVLGSGCPIVAGEWYTLVVSIRANSSGMANGRLRMWLKRNLDNTVCTVASADNKQFANDTSHASWHENYPRYWNVSVFRGGAGTPPAEDHYVRMDVIKWNNYFYDTYPGF
jgi:hypothetical protein